MRHFLIALAILFCFSTPISVSAQQLWAEYQNNYKHYVADSVYATTHTLDAFYLGKENKAGFSLNAFALATEGWGEVLVLPTWSTQTKAGFFSFSLGGGVETATPKPRLGAAAFYLKDKFEFLFFWEQGTDKLANNWHLSYLAYKVAEHEDGAYLSFGLHSQKGALHGFKAEIGDKDKFAVWVVLGKPTLTQRSVGALMGLRYFL